MPRRPREHASDDLEVRNVLAEIMNACNATAPLCSREHNSCELYASTTHASNALHALPHALQLPVPTGLGCTRTQRMRADVCGAVNPTPSVRGYVAREGQ